MSKANKAYLLDVGSTKVPVYCHMTSHRLDACGGGGWTLVMKIDGSKVFIYTEIFKRVAWSIITLFPLGVKQGNLVEGKFKNCWLNDVSTHCRQ